MSMLANVEIIVATIQLNQQPLSVIGFHKTLSDSTIAFSEVQQ